MERGTAVVRYNADPRIFRAADAFVDRALRRDDSLFTPGRAIWTLPYLEELDRVYVQNPDLGTGTFEEKLRTQLTGASPSATQLMAEVLFVYYLPARSNISGPVKRQKIREVLSWLPERVDMPPDLVEVTDFGVGSGGVGFHTYKWASVSFLISFARRWKQATQAVRDRALDDPWAFREFVAQVPTEGGGNYGRESLLYLVFPDTFERIFSTSDKWRLANALPSLVDDDAADVDRRIAQIRAKLESRFGPGFDFYEADGARALWKRFDDPMAEFIYWASRFHGLPTYGPDERDYKLEIVANLTAARDAVLAGGDWLPLLKHAFGGPNNLTPWQAHDTFLKWCQSDLDGAAKALRRLWQGEADPLLRLADFFGYFPHQVLPGMGSRIALGSFLMLAIDPRQYPPYRVTAMHAAYRLTGFSPGDEKDEVALYRAGLAFLDHLRERAAQRGLALSDRLDGQSVVWCITNWPAPEEWPPEDRAAFEKFRAGTGAEEEIDEGPEPPEEPLVGAHADPLETLADELLLERTALEEIAELLHAKGQVVFYGPPGTGKTFVALKLAAALAGDPGRVRLVQFHPSYAYEDFIEGYRPRPSDAGQPGFDLVPGPMRNLAERAIGDPAHDYFLIIDELNRGNIAKVFGELYFLLEYRDEAIKLQYSDAPFRLPPNLRLIGTMNTADRSIALLDAALRRRFSFVPFFPDRPPIQGLLGRWLGRNRPDMVGVAAVVDRANELLADRNAAIGPSYFMRKDLDQPRLESVWTHEIVPLLEDYFFDAPDRLREFQLASLQKAVAPPLVPGPQPAEPGLVELGESLVPAVAAPVEIDGGSDQPT